MKCPKCNRETKLEDKVHIFCDTAYIICPCGRRVIMNYRSKSEKETKTPLFHQGSIAIIQWEGLRDYQKKNSINK